MVNDAAAILGGLQSLKSAFEIGKALLNLGISAEIKGRIVEMNERILSAQESAIAAREYQSALLKQISDLEEQIAELEAWNAEAETYQLTDIRPAPYRATAGSAFAYAPKEGTHAGEPPHFICATCYEERHKSILVQQVLYPGACTTLICPRCSVILYIHGHPEPEHFGLKRPRTRR